MPDRQTDAPGEYVEPPFEPERESARSLASEFMLTASGGGSPRIDSFAGWALAGAGVMLAFLAGHDLLFAVSTAAFPNFVVAANLYLIAVGLVVLEKWLAVSIACGVDVADTFKRKIIEYLGDHVEIDKAAFTTEISQFSGIGRLWLWAAKRVTLKLVVDDYVGAGRLINWLVSVQILLTIAMLIILALALLFVSGQLGGLPVH